MTNKDKILHLAAQVDQLYRELDPIRKDPAMGLCGSHETGVTMSIVRGLSQRLLKLATLPDMEKEATL